jgi:hypothetical protein
MKRGSTLVVNESADHERLGTKARYASPVLSSNDVYCMPSATQPHLGPAVGGRGRGTSSVPHIRPRFLSSPPFNIQFLPSQAAAVHNTITAYQTLTMVSPRRRARRSPSESSTASPDTSTTHRKPYLHTSAEPSSSHEATTTTSSEQALANLHRAPINPGEFRNKCRFCPSTFAKSEHLKRHERSHTKERPYICAICDKKFTRGDSLTRHLRLHESGNVAMDNGQGEEGEEGEVALDVKTRRKVTGAGEDGSGKGKTQTVLQSSSTASPLKEERPEYGNSSTNAGIQDVSFAGVVAALRVHGDSQAKSCALFVPGCHRPGLDFSRIPATFPSHIGLRSIVNYAQPVLEITTRPGPCARSRPFGYRSGGKPLGEKSQEKTDIRIGYTTWRQTILWVR